MRRWHPRVIHAWLTAIGEGWIDSLIAERDGAIVGTAALVRDPLGWSAHVGEVRLRVVEAQRGAGLGRDLLQAVMAIAAERGLAKLTAAMTPTMPPRSSCSRRWASAARRCCVTRSAIARGRATT
ncbi:GNAT family N-acetyltransferase [Sphingomonas sp. MMS24-JH45]